MREKFGRRYSSAKKREDWDRLPFKDYPEVFTGNTKDNFSQKLPADQTSTTGENRVSIKKSLDVQKGFCLCSKTYCCSGRKSNKNKFSIKGLKRDLEDYGNGVLKESVNVTLTNRGFGSFQGSVAT